MPHAVWVPRANKHEFDLFFTFWTFDTPEPSIVLIKPVRHRQIRHVARARSIAAAYSDPEFDAVLDDGASSAMDREATRETADQGDRHRSSRCSPPCRCTTSSISSGDDHSRSAQAARADGHVLAADVIGCRNDRRDQGLTGTPIPVNLQRLIPCLSRG